MFLFNTEEGVGIGFRLGGGRPATGCCLTHLGRGSRPMTYIETAAGRGVVIAHVSPDIERVRYDCIQCKDVAGIIPRHENGRLHGIPQIAVLFVGANEEGGNDGYLIAYDASHIRVDRDWIGLPPACSARRCPVGLVWGSLVPGTETHFVVPSDAG